MKIRVKIFAGMLIMAVMAGACSTALKGSNRDLEDVSAESYDGFKAAKIDEILILPVLLRSRESQGGVLQDPDRVLGVPDKNSTSLLVNAMEANSELNIVDLPRDEIIKYVPETGLSKELLFKKAGEVAKATQVSNVVFAIIDEKDSRTGGGLGSERSSSIGYRVWMYNLGLDKVIWFSAYQSNQQALTSNLFEMGDKFDRGLGFKTPDELLKKAFKNTVLKLKKDISQRNISQRDTLQIDISQKKNIQRH